MNAIPQYSPLKDNLDQKSNLINVHAQRTLAQDQEIHFQYRNTNFYKINTT